MRLLTLIGPAVLAFGVFCGDTEEVPIPPPIHTVTSTTAMPTIRLVVPDSPVAYGDLIIVQAAVDKSTVPEALVDMQHQWIVLENGQRKSVIIWPDGTQVFFAAGMQPRQFTVIVDTHCLFVTKDKDTITKAWMELPDPLIAVINVGAGPAPTPPPGPVPPGPTPPSPTPTPPAPLPDGQFGLAKFTYDALASDGNMSQADKVKLANSLAPSFTTIAAKIAALADYKDVEKQILPDLKASNSAALASSGVSIPTTMAFKNLLNARLYSLYHDQPAKLISAADFGTAFREIATGLSSYK